MTRRVKDKKVVEAGTLPPLSPEDREALDASVGRVAETLTAESDPEALKNLVQTRPLDSIWDLHLIAALGAMVHPVIPKLLAALFAAAPDKARRKALKRAFHALQSRGVAAPAELLPREEALMVREIGAGLRAHLSQSIEDGQRYVVLEGPRDLLGGNIMAARVHDQEGFRELHVFSLKSKHREDFWDSLTHGGAIDFQPVAVPYALGLLEVAYQANPGASEAAAYGACRERLLAREGPPQAPDLEALLGEITPAERSRLLDDSRKLAHDQLFYFWIPDREKIAPWYARLKEILDSRLVLTDQQKQARIDALADEASQAVFPPEARPVWRRRLRDMAYYLLLKGRREDARAAAAAADDLVVERSHLQGAATFIKALTILALRFSWEVEKGPEKDESPLSLLAPPTESLIIGR